MAEMAAAAWAVVKAASAYIIKAGAAVAAGNATLAQTAAVIAVNVAGSVAMSAIAGVLAKPSVGSTAPGEWVADPNAGIPFAIGERIGAGGNLAYKNTYGKDTEYKGIITILSGAGPIGGFLSFTADKEAVSWAGDTWPADPTQTATSAPYRGEKMWMRRQLGQQPEVFALASPSSLGGWSLPEWTWQHKLSGKTAFHWTLRRDSKFSAFEQGEPDPLTVMEGIAGYDPRFDSTYPGGEGPVRLADRTTWPTIRNGAIADLNWCLGLRENGKVVGGLGVSAAGIDWAAYIETANVADANGWKIAAYPRSDENKSEVRAAMLQSAGAVISRRAGLVSCVTRGVAKVPVMTIRAGDTAGPIELDTAANVLNRLNSITPRYLSEAHDWQMVAAGPVSSAVYLDEDNGRLASDARDYPYVPSAKQAAELAALDLAHTREGIGGRWPLKPYCRDIEPGEAFDIDEPGLLLDGMTMLCLTRDYDPGTDTVWLTFVSETEGKVDWALGRTPSPPPTPSLSARPVLNPPTEEEVVIIPRLPGEDGVQVPIIDVEVTPDNPRAEVVVIEWAAAEGDPPPPIEDIEEPEELAWSPSYEGRAVAGTVAINGLQPGAVVYLSIQYRTANEGLSTRLLSGPFTVPGLTVDISPDAPALRDIIQQQASMLEAQAGLLESQRALMEAVVKSASDRLTGAQGEFADRLRQVNDLIARLRLVAETDPVGETAILRGDVILEGEDGRTLVQTFETVRAATDAAVALVHTTATAIADDISAEAAARQQAIALVGENLAAAEIALRSYADGQIAEATADLAVAAEVADAIAAAGVALRAYTDGQVSEATADLATTAALGSAIATADLALRSWTNGQISVATANLATTAAVGDAIATADLALRSYTDGQISEATADLMTTAQVDDAIASADLALRSYTDGQISEAAADLATAVQLADAIAGADLALRSWTNGQISEATATLATMAAVEDAISAADLALRSYADDKVSEATADLTTAAQLADAISVADLTLRSWTNGQIATATAGLATQAEIDDAIAAADLLLRSYTDGKVAEATAGLATAAQVADDIAAADLGLRSYTDEQVSEATAGLDTAAARDAALAAAGIALRSYTDDELASAIATLAAQSEVEALSAIAYLALSTANGDEANIALLADVGGRATGMRVNGADQIVEFLASYFKVTATGSAGIDLDATAGVLKVFDASNKTLLLASGDIRLWSGPTSVADNAITEENGVLALGPGVTGGGRFNGVTLSGPFDSGLQTGDVSLSTSAWTDIAVIDSKIVVNGSFLTWPAFSFSGQGSIVNPSDPPEERLAVLSLPWRVISTDPSGGDVEVLEANTTGGTRARGATGVTGSFGITRSAFQSVAGAKTGNRRIVLQAMIGVNGTVAVASSRRLSGFYAA